MDPWMPQKSVNSVTSPPLPLPPEPSRQDFTSDQYLSIIEGKLKKLKGSTKKEPLAKDILIGLDKLRECQMHSVVNDKDSPYISNSEYDSDSIEPTSLLNLQRKLAPEKQAINNEEIKPLIDNDVLAQIQESLFSNSQLNEQEKTG